MLKADNLTIEILEDGTIKTTTDAISGANHANAEQFLKYIATLAGGTTTRTRRADTTHTQAHSHQDTEHE